LLGELETVVRHKDRVTIRCLQYLQPSAADFQVHPAWHSVLGSFATLDVEQFLCLDFCKMQKNRSASPALTGLIHSPLRAQAAWSLRAESLALEFDRTSVRSINPMLAASYFA